MALLMENKALQLQAREWLWEQPAWRERKAMVVEALRAEIAAATGEHDERYWITRSFQIGAALEAGHGPIPQLSDWPGWAEARRDGRVS